MRNLKKFLALALAMMMVMGLMVTVNAATTADYTDSDEIDPAYQEAVDVLVALGAIEGSSGKLTPTATFTRAQLATMMYKVVYGADGDNDPRVIYAANADYFTDVPKGSIYPAGYINFAYEQDWVSGRGNGKYDPNTEVTVVEVLQAMLNILKVETIGEGNWKTKAINTAVEIGLTDGLLGNTGLTGDATREEAFQVFYNGLTYTPDEVTMYTVTCDDSNYHDEPFVYPTTDQTLAAALYAVHGDHEGANFAEGRSLEGSLLDTVYDVTAIPGLADAYGRPATLYIQGDLNGADAALLVTVVDSDALVLESDNGFTGNELYTMLGTKAKIDVYYSSALLGGSLGYSYYETVDGTKTNTTGIGGNSVRVEIFKLPTKDEYRAVVISPVLTQVTAVNHFNKNATKGARYEYTLTGVDETLVDYENTVSEENVTNVFFIGDEDDWTPAEDEYVLVDIIKEYDEDGAVVRSYVVTPVETIDGTITKHMFETKTYTISGESYTESEIDYAVGSSLDSNMNKTAHTIALDANGYVVAVIDKPRPATVSAPASYIYVMKMEASDFVVEGVKYSNSVRVSGITNEGKWESFVLNRVNGNSARTTVSSYSGDIQDLGGSFSANTGRSTTRNCMYIYVKCDDGTYDLYHCSNTLVTNLNAGKDNNALTAKQVTDFTRAVDTVYKNKGSGFPDKVNLTFAINGKSQLTTGLYASESTKYYIAGAVYDDNGDFVRFSNSVIPYTGYSNAGNIDLEDGNASRAVAAIDYNKDGIAEVVIIGAAQNENDDTPSTGASYYTWITEEIVRQNDDDGNTWTYVTLVNGEEGSVTLTSRYSGWNSLPALVRISTTGTGSSAKTTATVLADTGTTTADLVNTSKVSTTVVLTANNDTYVVSNGFLKLNDATNGSVVAPISTNMKVYVVDGDGIKESSLKEGDKITSDVKMIVFVSDGEKITEIYINKVAEAVVGSNVSGNAEIESVKSPTTVKPGATLTVEKDVTANITVEEGAELVVKGNVKKGATIKAKDLSSVTVVGECEEAIVFDSEDEDFDASDLTTPIIVSFTDDNAGDGETYEDEPGTQTIFIKFRASGSSPAGDFTLTVYDEDENPVMHIHQGNTTTTAFVFCPSRIDTTNTKAQDEQNSYSVWKGGHDESEEMSEAASTRGGFTWATDDYLRAGYYTIEIINDATGKPVYSGGFTANDPVLNTPET